MKGGLNVESDVFGAGEYCDYNDQGDGLGLQHQLLDEVFENGGRRSVLSFDDGQPRQTVGDQVDPTVPEEGKIQPILQT